MGSQKEPWPRDFAAMLPVTGQRGTISNIWSCHLQMEFAHGLVHFLKTCCLRAFAGSATLQRGFWSRAGARRSQDNAQALLWRYTNGLQERGRGNHAAATPGLKGIQQGN